MRPLLWMAAHALGAVLTLAPGNARADVAETCATVYESAQEHRRAGELVLASTELKTCSVACPGELRADCERWQKELEVEIPSLRVSTKSARGKTLVDVQGLLLSTQAPVPTDGSPLPLDPGEHRLRFTRGEVAVEQRVVLSPGERRLLEVVFPADESSALKTAPTPATQPDSRPVAKPFPSPFEVVGLALGGVALGLSITGHVRVASLRDSCAPTCDEAQVDVVRALWWAAAASGVLGATAFGVGYAGRF